MEQRDWELLHKQMRATGLERNDGLVGLAMLIVFCVGLMLGTALLPDRTPNQQFASMEQTGSAQKF